MKADPLVTIYVPCRNYGQFLTQCVESVLSQLYKNWELIIVDEASTDNTLAVAENLRSRNPDRIVVLRNITPVGLQRIANHVLSLANGKYMMRLDADDWLDEGALLLMVAKLESTPGIGLVYGNYFYTNLAGQVLGMERRYKLGSEDTAGHLPPHGACTLFRTRSLKVVGGYSEDVDAQDGWELWYKLSKRVGAASLEVPVFYYRQHDLSLSRDYGRLLRARTRILERIGAALEGNYSPSCAVVIPVRESYPGVDGVPYRTFEGQSLLERAILSAKQARMVSKVIVSSQSQRVLDYAARLEEKGHVPAHLRVHRGDDFEGVGSVPIREILVHAGVAHAEHFGTLPDVLMFLSIHAVRRRSEHIDKAMHVLRISESDSVVSVREEREPLFSHGNDGLRLLNPGRFHDLSHDRERLYRFNGAILGAWWEVLNENSLLGEKVSYIEMSEEDSWEMKTPSMLSAAGQEKGV